MHRCVLSAKRGKREHAAVPAPAELRERWHKTARTMVARQEGAPGKIS